MKRFMLMIIITALSFQAVIAQNISAKANAFISLLSATERNKAVYPFDTTERYRFHYIPQNDRKGISINELNTRQQSALMGLLRSCLSRETIKKIDEIRGLENVLKEMEHRTAEDHFRDSGKYMITIFGIPSPANIWGWRFEGHHIAFHFSTANNKIISGTPGFLGSNPAVVQSGSHKDEEVLKEETDKGFALLQALSPDELKNALIDSLAPGEIITGASRSAMINQPAGVQYRNLTPAHQQMLLQLINLYIHRYTTLFADNMLKEIQTAGLDNIWFAWAGSTKHIFGKAYYYRIQAPTIIIEYDNSQNNANHIHTVVRDLKTDFGGDLLLEHYRQSHTGQPSAAN